MHLYSCKKVARNAVNQNACVHVEFTVWQDAKKLTKPQKISFAFPPPPLIQPRLWNKKTKNLSRKFKINNKKC